MARRGRELGDFTGPSNDFGMPVAIRPQILPKQDFSPSGTPNNNGLMPSDGSEGKGYREVFPPGNIGSNEGKDDLRGAPFQHVDTVQSYAGEARDPSLHSPSAALRSAQRSPELRTYASYCTPITDAMPKAVQDDLYLRGYGKNVADPRMEDATWGPDRAYEPPDIVDLYGKNIDDVPHNQGHPGFQAVASKISAKEGIPMKNAAAILASASRKASPAAKKANPSLKNVKG